MINLIKVEIEKGVFVLLSPEDIEKYKLSPVKEEVAKVIPEVQATIIAETKVVKPKTKKGE